MNESDINVEINTVVIFASAN